MCGKRCLIIQFFTGTRMDKAKGIGVQCLPREIQIILPCTVERVTHQRMTKISHMDTNLMGAAGFQAAFDKGMACKTFFYGIMGAGFFAVFQRDCHLFAVCFMAADWCVHQTGRFTDDALHQRIVGASDAVFFQLCRQMLMGQVVFCNHQQTGRVFVDAVYKAAFFR